MHVWIMIALGSPCSLASFYVPQRASTRKAWDMLFSRACGVSGIWQKNRDYEGELELAGASGRVRRFIQVVFKGCQLLFCFKENLWLCFALACEAISASSPRRKDFGTKCHGSSLTSRPSADLLRTFREFSAPGSSFRMTSNSFPSTISQVPTTRSI